MESILALIFKFMQGLVQDMEWAEKVKHKYMAAQAEMICG